MAITDSLPAARIPAPRLPLTANERLVEAERLFGPDAQNVLNEVPGLLDLELMHGVTFPHPSLEHVYSSGCAEPWTTQLVASLLLATNQRSVVEIGGFTGQTSAWLACALDRIGGGTLTVLEIDPDRARQIQDRLNGLGLTRTNFDIILGDSLQTIQRLQDKSVGFVWQDGNHEKYHVDAEIGLLWPKMKPGGVITGHDVFGSCDLQTVYRKYGGVCLDLPRLGRAGGVGIISIPK